MRPASGKVWGTLQRGGLPLQLQKKISKKSVCKKRNLRELQRRGLPWQLHILLLYMYISYYMEYFWEFVACYDECENEHLTHVRGTQVRGTQVRGRDSQKLVQKKVLKKSVSRYFCFHIWRVRGTSSWQRFSKVRALIYLRCKVTIQRTFENLLRRRLLLFFPFVVC